jgi:uncharacterized membrane protein (Fun14 family)
MSDANRRGSGPSAGGAARKELPRWKKVVLTAAGFLVVAGGALQLFALARGDKAEEGGKVASDHKNQGGNPLDPAAGAGFLERGDPPARDADGEASTVKDWSPVLLKGGLSFFLGFCIGYAVRTFFRISAVVIGLVGLAIFGLSYAGVLNVDWHMIEQGFDRIVAGVKEQASGFQAFITGSLPSAGLAAMGLFTGFKKN